MAVGAITG